MIIFQWIVFLYCRSDFKWQILTNPWLWSHFAFPKVDRKNRIGIRNQSFGGEKTELWLELVAGLRIGTSNFMLVTLLYYWVLIFENRNFTIISLNRSNVSQRSFLLPRGNWQVGSETFSLQEGNLLKGYKKESSCKGVKSTKHPAQRFNSAIQVGLIWPITHWVSSKSLFCLMSYFVEPRCRYQHIS